MQSWLDIALQRFERDNDTLVVATRSLLNRIVPEAPLHARLANTLSMLEHLGSHKIMATQHSSTVDQPTLKHVAEEAHHAYFMKRQAEKVAGRSLEYVEADLLAPATARMYFQRLESAMAQRLERQRSAHSSTYLFMSMIVEFRALWFYQLYEQTLKQVGAGFSLKRVLGEERHHLTDIAERLERAGELSDARVDEFLAAEKKLFERFLGAMQRSVGV